MIRIRAKVKSELSDLPSLITVMNRYRVRPSAARMFTMLTTKNTASLAFSLAHVLVCNKNTDHCLLQQYTLADMYHTNEQVQSICILIILSIDLLNK
jgi:hypothetical protein